MNGISRSLRTDGLDPRPKVADTEVDEDLPDGIESVGYRGAFRSISFSGTWLDGWSTLSKFGYLAKLIALLIINMIKGGS